MKNKTLRRVLLAALTIIVLSVSCTAAFGCTDDNDPNVFASGASMTLVIDSDPRQTVDVDLSGMDKDIDLVDVLDKAEVSYDLQGTMLKSVGSLAPQAPEYIYIYTSVAADYDVSQWAASIEYDGKELINSGVGALEMTIEDGCVVFVGTIVWR